MGDDVTAFLETALAQVEGGRQPSPPPALKALIDRWPWGRYGWTSPVNLLLTAAWRKAMRPDQDVCRIWYYDAQRRPIADAYSIRNLDESYTVPFVNKHDIFKNFCSPNSGMQGSRALEKGRSVTGRLDRDWSANQRTVFDLDLFADIMNDMDGLDAAQARETLAYLLSIAVRFRDERIAAQKAILALRYDSAGVDLASLPERFDDPEFVRALVAATVASVLAPAGASWSVRGTDGAKTAADARSGNPGDLWVADEAGVPVVGFEVKDRTRTIDWTVLRRASGFLKAFPGMRAFIIVVANKAPLADRVAPDVRDPARLFRRDGFQRNVSVLSIYDLINLAVITGRSDEVFDRTGVLVATMPSIKPETRERWAGLFS